MRGNIWPQAARGLAAATLAALWLGACTADPGLLDVPGGQKLTWFSYLNGDDIRRACVPGAAARTRVVYNGHYNEQLRTYDLVADAGGGALVEARVQTGSGVAASNVTLTLDDPIASWRWRTAQDRLAPGAAARLEQALEESGFFAPAPHGLRLHSNAFYWLAVGCRDGAVHFNAWVYETPRFTALTFPDVLLLYDATGMAMNPPRARDLEESLRGAGVPRKQAINRDSAPYFVIDVGENGLVGHPGG